MTRITIHTSYPWCFTRAVIRIRSLFIPRSTLLLLLLLLLLCYPLVFFSATPNLQPRPSHGTCAGCPVMHMPFNRESTTWSIFYDTYRLHVEFGERSLHFRPFWVADIWPAQWAFGTSSLATSRHPYWNTCSTPCCQPMLEHDITRKQQCL